MNGRCWILTGLLLLTLSAFSQTELETFYDLDDCSGIATGSFQAIASIEGNPDCVCGVAGNALRLDGNDDRILIPDTIRSLFEDDWTVGFYFRSDNSENTTDLFSFRSRCQVDSTLSIKYVPITNMIRVEIAESFQNIQNLEATISPDACWTHITVTKFNLVYSLYINGQLVDEELASREVQFGKNAKIAFSNSPCLVINEDRLEGDLDQIEFRNYALAAAEVQSLYLAPDRILTRDTTIFAGGNVPIELGPSCANSVSWSPVEGLDNSDVVDPIASPEETTIYVVTLVNDVCTIRDTLTINVIDPGAVNCNDLLLPKAFTPNNDGLNEQYGISNDFIIDELLSFSILDRWGAQVFSTSSTSEKWDGSFNGQPVNPGMFVYEVRYRCNNEEYVVVDNFTVLR